MNLFISHRTRPEWWADPQKQNKPAAWTNLDFDALVNETGAYRARVIKTLKDAGATPDFVQIGNEITGGMLWPDGQVKVPLSTVPGPTPAPCHLVVQNPA